MLSFTPLSNSFGSDFYVDCMTEISGNVPNFGTVAVDHNEDYHESQVLLNGKGFRDRFALLLLYGPINPVFYVGAISTEKIFTEKSVVTASNRNQLQKVDGVPVMEYLQSLGLTRNADGTVTGINAFPLIVDYNDGTTSVVRTMFAITPEGYAVCAGNIPEGATLSVGSFDEEDIIATARRTLNTALATGRHKTLLMYSCIGRYFSQGYDTSAEFKAMLDSLTPSDVNYMAAYSGGELCPVYDKNGESFNRNHGNSFIVCAF
jgi:hypothetical protein